MILEYLVERLTSRKPKLLLCYRIHEDISIQLENFRISMRKVFGQLFEHLKTGLSCGIIVNVLFMSIEVLLQF